MAYSSSKNPDTWRGDPKVQSAGSGYTPSHPSERVFEASTGKFVIPGPDGVYGAEDLDDRERARRHEADRIEPEHRS